MVAASVLAPVADSWWFFSLCSSFPSLTAEIGFFLPIFASLVDFGCLARKESSSVRSVPSVGLKQQPGIDGHTMNAIRSTSKKSTARIQRGAGVNGDVSALFFDKLIFSMSVKIHSTYSLFWKIFQ